MYGIIGSARADLGNNVQQNGCQMRLSEKEGARRGMEPYGLLPVALYLPPFASGMAEGVSPLPSPPIPFPPPSLTIGQGHQQTAAHARVGHLETLYMGGRGAHEGHMGFSHGGGGSHGGHQQAAAHARIGYLETLSWGEEGEWTCKCRGTPHVMLEGIREGMEE